MNQTLINNINHQIEILTAYRDGKTLQFKIKGNEEWIDYFSITTNFSDHV